MNDEAELYIQRAENELVAAQMLFDISSRNRCFADPEYFTQVIATSDAFLDYFFRL